MAISLKNIEDRVEVLENKSSSGVSVVEKYQNGDDWYVKYSDGFIMQSGYTSVPTGGTKNFTFHIPMSTTKYAITLNGQSNSSWDYSFRVLSMSTTGMSLGVRFGGNCRWFVYGYLVTIVSMIILGGVVYGNIS